LALSAATLQGTGVKYPPHSPLRSALTEAARSHLDELGVRPEGGGRLVLKSLVVFAWGFGSYALLVFWAATWWQAALLVLSLGLAMAAIGFNVQHDGSHGTYSRRRAGNRLSALALDLMGGSSYLWHYKHNVLHHQFTNVEGVDDDLNAGPLLRLAPGQRRRWFHRFQCWYIWALYAFLPPKWQFWDDFQNLVTGRIGDQRIPRPKGPQLSLFVLGKLVFLLWAFVIPLLFHSPGKVLLAYAGTALVLGVVLGTVFQLAHCVEEAGFATIPSAPDKMESPWVEHQLATTMDFAPSNRLLSWYVGGLNFQVEHHLFPKVSHIHYPRLQPVVRRVCGEHGIAHLSHDTLRGALSSHVRYLRRMGRAG
jgi:linoleoyl-CoA desaturase